MGWFWDKKQSGSNSDPFRDLDPSLRDFLEKESPVKYQPTPAPPPPPKEETAPSSSLPNAAQPKPLVPRESLYQDGRYSHLWKNYRPLSDVENETKSDQEKLLDVLDGYKARKAQIGRAAVENCVEEQLKVDACYEKGSWMDRFTMCRTENRRFERCYIMQSRFLKALGYLAVYDRPASVDEEIQMHADTLYHRMLAQEKAVEDAKAAGQPVPQFPSILSPRSSASATSAVPKQSTSSPSDPSNLPPLSSEVAQLLTPEAAKSLRERLKNMTPIEREVEERSMIMEVEAATATSQHLKDIKDAKEKRREEGKATAGDTISGWFGW